MYFNFIIQFFVSNQYHNTPFNKTNPIKDLGLSFVKEISEHIYEEEVGSIGDEGKYNDYIFIAFKVICILISLD